MRLLEIQQCRQQNRFKSVSSAQFRYGSLRELQQTIAAAFTSAILRGVQKERGENAQAKLRNSISANCAPKSGCRFIQLRRQGEFSVRIVNEKSTELKESVPFSAPEMSRGLKVLEL